MRFLSAWRCVVSARRIVASDDPCPDQVKVSALVKNRLRLFAGVGSANCSIVTLMTFSHQKFHF